MAPELSFLLDTNVIIQFEETGSDRRIRDPFQRLHSLLIENRLSFTFHPLTENDLQKDKDKERLGEIMSRLRKYPKLDNPPSEDNLELEKEFGGISNSNDLIDCQLLFAISRNCATYLITEDQGIHKRAENANLDDRVLYVGDTIELIVRQYKPETVQLPNIKHEYLYNLDLQSPLFNSLKSDYNGFEDWINRNAQRQCWTINVRLSK